MFLHFLGELQRSLRVPLFQSYSRVLGTQIYAAHLRTMRNRQPPRRLRGGNQRLKTQTNPHAQVATGQRHLIFDKRRMVPRNLVGQVAGKRRQGQAR